MLTHRAYAGDQLPTTVFQTNTGDGYTNPTPPTNARTGGAVLPQQLDYLDNEATLSESNLPEYMAKLEPGTFNKATRTWSHPRTNPCVLCDHGGAGLISQSTGRLLRHVAFLPTMIPENVEAWRLNYWMRKAAESGIFLSYDDIADRMPLVVSTKARPDKIIVNTNVLSMRLQRYIEGIGQLSIVEKRKGGLPALQAMETIEQLYVIQGKLNTWWLPTNMTNRGPWMVVQPKLHPGYEGKSTSDHRSTSALIEQAYGLSDRVRRTSDAIIFLDVAAQEAGLQGSANDRKYIRETKLAREWDAEFEYWRTGGHGSLPTVQQIRVALDRATDDNEVLAILSGECETIMSLQTPSADRLAGRPSMWSRMTSDKVAWLKKTARSNAISGSPTMSTPTRITPAVVPTTATPGAFTLWQGPNEPLDADEMLLAQLLMAENNRLG